MRRRRWKAAARGRGTACRWRRRARHDPAPRSGAATVRIELRKEKHMKAVTIHNFRSLLAGYEPPCVSIYMTTDPHRPGGAGDRLRLKNLLRSAVRELERSYARTDAISLVEPLAEAFDSGS